MLRAATLGQRVGDQRGAEVVFGGGGSHPVGLGSRRASSRATLGPEIGRVNHGRNVSGGAGEGKLASPRQRQPKSKLPRLSRGIDSGVESNKAQGKAYSKILFE